MSLGCRQELFRQVGHKGVRRDAVIGGPDGEGVFGQPVDKRTILLRVSGGFGSGPAADGKMTRRALGNVPGTIAVIMGDLGERVKKEQGQMTCSLANSLLGSDSRGRRLFNNEALENIRFNLGPLYQPAHEKAAAKLARVSVAPCADFLEKS